MLSQEASPIVSCYFCQRWLGGWIRLCFTYSTAASRVVDLNVECVSRVVFRVCCVCLCVCVCVFIHPIALGIRGQTQFPQAFLVLMCFCVNGTYFRVMLGSVVRICKFWVMSSVRCVFRLPPPPPVRPPSDRVRVPLRIE